MAVPGDTDIESIRSIVRGRFNIYETFIEGDKVVFYVDVNGDTLYEDFESIRIAMKGVGMIPSIATKGGEHILTIVRAPKLNTRSVMVNQIMLAITAIATIYAGAVLWSSYTGDELYDWATLGYGALFFALPLMAILGVHELSHYLMSKRHNVEASLPFFIPFIPPLGTLGAFISIREPIPDRRALLSIGIAGPIGGLLVTIPVTIIGLWLTAQGEPIPPGTGTGGSMTIMLQPLFMLFTYIIPIPENVALHPTAFAAWVGFLVTAINLLPAGQLDGGHVVRAAMGNKARYVSYIAAFALIGLTFFYSGWFLFAILIIFLGLQHPPPLNDISPIDRKGVALALAGLLIFVTCFSPIPMAIEGYDHSIEVTYMGDDNVTAYPGDIIHYTVTVNNTGNTASDVQFNIEDLPPMWGSSIWLVDDPDNITSGGIGLALEYGGNATIEVLIEVSSSASVGEDHMTLSTRSSSDEVNQDILVTVISS